MRWVKRFYYGSLYFLFAVVFLSEFKMIGADGYVILTTCGMPVFLASALIMTRGFQLYVSIASLVIGHAILLHYNLDFGVWHQSLTKGIAIPVLFVVIPMMSFPIRFGDYLSAVEGQILSHRRRPGAVFCLLVLLHLCLAIALNIGSIPFLQKLLDQTRLSPKYLARLYSAGYASYIVFSPYDAVVNMFLMLAGTTFSEYAPAGACMVALIVGVSVLLLKTDRELIAFLKKSLPREKSQTPDNRKLLELLAHFAVLIGLAVLADRFLPFSNAVYGIVVIIIGYSLLWGGLLGVLPRYKAEAAGYSAYLLNFRTFLPFLIATSFLGSVFAHTPLREAIGAVLALAGALPLYVVLQLFMLLTMGLALCGVHMMITITALAFAVDPHLIHLTHPAFALTLLSCWFMAMSISPFAPFAVIVAETIDSTAVQVTLGYNRRFCLILLFAAPALILAINGLFR